jgi:hypothetical protein
MWRSIEPNLKLIQPLLAFRPGRFKVAMHVRRGERKLREYGVSYEYRIWSIDADRS